MAQNKYEKYIITEIKPGLKLPEFRGDPLAAPKSAFLFWLGEKVIPGSPQLECVWIWPRVETTGFPAHTHEGTEIIGFLGTDPKDIHDLGGEIEFWFEDEKYLLTKSCLLYIPEGLKHCPIVFKKIDRPILHFLITIGGEY